MMNQQTLTHFRQRLLDMDRSITEDVGAMREQTLQPSGGQTAGEISNAPMHLGDRGTEEYLNQLSTTLLSNEESLVNEVRDALARIDAGVYGNCEECGREIAHERLEALPFTNLCIQCASKSSRPTANLNTGRPRNPDDTLAPEGEMGESRRSTQGQFRESPMQISQEGQRADSDSHAVGTPGGGDAWGGLAGSNVGSGDPVVSELENSMGAGNYEEPQEEPIERPRDRR